MGLGLKGLMLGTALAVLPACKSEPKTQQTCAEIGTQARAATFNAIGGVINPNRVALMADKKQREAEDRCSNEEDDLK